MSTTGGFSGRLFLLHAPSAIGVVSTGFDRFQKRRFPVVLQGGQLLCLAPLK